MNERLLEAIKKLKKEQDEIEIDLKLLKKDIEEKGTMNMQKALFAMADDLARYTIVDSYWYYNGKNTGIKAEGYDGKDGAPGKDGYTPVKGKDYFDGAPGKDGYTPVKGKDYFDGAPGKDGYTPVKGKDYFDGAPGKDGKDGETPVIKIGKVETSPEYGGALAKLRKGKDGIIYLDLTLPRGPQGFPGFDGKDAKINGVNTLNIVAGENITIDQEDDTLTINSTGGGAGTITDVKVNNESVVEDGVADIDISGKQNITDSSLQTSATTVTGAINEVNSIAKGANQAVSYDNYSSLITEFNVLDDDVYRVGQNLYILTLEVPDLWVSSIESTSTPYIYTTDSAFINEIETNGYVQVGYYKLSMLETQKVDLTNYVEFTDYATQNVGGVAKMWTSLNEDDEIGLNISTQ